MGLPLMLLALQAITPDPKPAPMKCDTGPVSRRLGGTDWLVYSCADQASMVVISAKGNPALPFVFILSYADGHYRIHGEGNGDRQASNAAGNALSRMTHDELAALLAATRTH